MADVIAWTLIGILILSVGMISTVYAELKAIPSVYQINAQNSTSFVTYRNTTLGFSIEHPQNWPVVNQSISDNRGVMFRPFDEVMPSFSVRTMDLTPYLDTDTLTVKNKTLEQVAQEFRTNISKPKDNLLGIEMEPKLIRQNQVSVDGKPGWKFEMTISIGPENDRGMYAYFYIILTTANGKLYSLEYDEKPLKVPETLPIADKMVNSFHIIPIESRLISEKPASDTLPENSEVNLEISELLNRALTGLHTPSPISYLLYKFAIVN